MKKILLVLLLLSPIAACAESVPNCYSGFYHVGSNLCVDTFGADLAGMDPWYGFNALYCTINGGACVLKASQGGAAWANLNNGEIGPGDIRKAQGSAYIAGYYGGQLSEGDPLYTPPSGPPSPAFYEFGGGGGPVASQFAGAFSLAQAQTDAIAAGVSLILLLLLCIGFYITRKNTTTVKAA